MWYEKRVGLSRFTKYEATRSTASLGRMLIHRRSLAIISACHSKKEHELYQSQCVVLSPVISFEELHAQYVCL